MLQQEVTPEARLLASHPAFSIRVWIKISHHQDMDHRFRSMSPLARVVFGVPICDPQPFQAVLVSFAFDSVPA